MNSCRACFWGLDTGPTAHGFSCRFLLYRPLIPSRDSPPHIHSALPSRWRKSQHLLVTLPPALEGSEASVGKGNGLRVVTCDSRCHHVTVVAAENTEEVLPRELMLEAESGMGGQPWVAPVAHSGCRMVPRRGRPRWVWVLPTLDRSHSRQE